jgi:hypothetical protein
MIDSQACPEYTKHDAHVHYDDKTADDELSKAVDDYVRLCIGVGAL